LGVVPPDSSCHVAVPEDVFLRIWPTIPPVGICLYPTKAECVISGAVPPELDKAPEADTLVTVPAPVPIATPFTLNAPLISTSPNLENVTTSLY